MATDSKTRMEIVKECVTTAFSKLGKAESRKEWLVAAPDVTAMSTHTCGLPLSDLTMHVWLRRQLSQAQHAPA